MNKYFTPENEVPGSTREHLSPSGAYRLVTSSYGTKPGSWDYTQGKIYKVGSDTPLATIRRNYSSFPFTWVEGHADGHSYLIGGASYQGQTVIQLDTGKRRDNLPPEAKEGVAFCWIETRYDVASKLLIVSGCHWACPCEFRLYDFSDPMSGWPELEIVDNYIDADEKWPDITEGTIKSYQTETDDAGEPTQEGTLAAIKTFKREGLKLILLEEWVSEVEKARILVRDEANRKYEEWKTNFRATDPLYLAMKEGLTDPVFTPDAYDSVGVTHQDWSPDFKGNERRMCRRILNRNKGTTPWTVDLEWAVETGPIKLDIYKGGNRSEAKWFEHSVEGMIQALAYAKSLVGV